MGLRLIIGTSLYVHKSVATKQQTMNSAALYVPPYFCPYLIESSALHLYIIVTIPILMPSKNIRVIRRNAAEIHRRMPYNKK